jgi:2-amino-4-hydroxy-6-hydroxymethyldihydropteridine diphosphokinase
VNGETPRSAVDFTPHPSLLTPHSSRKRAFIGLGSNLSDPGAQILKAYAELGNLLQTRLLSCSSLYRSAPVGYADQPDFINAVAEIETALAPHQLLEALLDMEHRHGRVREFRNAPRILDLDILLYDDLTCHEHGLTLPHPRMHERAFVLQPLHEIAPSCIIAGHGSVAACLEKCIAQRVERVEGSRP